MTELIYIFYMAVVISTCFAFVWLHQENFLLQIATPKDSKNPDPLNHVPSGLLETWRCITISFAPRRSQKWYMVDHRRGTKGTHWYISLCFAHREVHIHKRMSPLDTTARKNGISQWLKMLCICRLFDHVCAVCQGEHPRAPATCRYTASFLNHWLIPFSRLWCQVVTFSCGYVALPIS